MDTLQTGTGSSSDAWSKSGGSFGSTDLTLNSTGENSAEHGHTASTGSGNSNIGRTAGFSFATTLDNAGAFPDLTASPWDSDNSEVYTNSSGFPELASPDDDSNASIPTDGSDNFNYQLGLTANQNNWSNGKTEKVLQAFQQMADPAANLDPVIQKALSQVLSQTKTPMSQNTQNFESQLEEFSTGINLSANDTQSLRRARYDTNAVLPPRLASYYTFLTGQLPANTPQIGSQALFNQTTLNVQYKTSFSQVLQNEHLSSDDAAKVLFALNNPNVPIDPETAKLLATAQQDTQNLMNTQYHTNVFSPNWTAPSPPASASMDNGNMTDAYEAAFEKELGAYAVANNLNSDAVEALKSAFYSIPGAPLSAANEQILQTLQSKAAGDIQSEYGLPTHWIPTPNAEKFASKANDTFDNNFESELSNFAQANGLTPTQIKALQFMHYNPGSEAGDSPSEIASNQANLLTLNGSANASTNASLGIRNSNPQPDTEYFNSQLTGTFNFQLDNLLQNQEPPLSESDQMLVKYAATTGQQVEVPDGSPDLNEIAGSLKAQVYGLANLPSAFTPTMSIGNYLTNSYAFSTTQNIFKQSTEQLKSATANATAFLNPSGVLSMGNYLELIGKAIDAMKEFEYQLEAMDAKRADKFTQAKTSDSMSQLSVQKTMMDYANEQSEIQAKKAAKMKPLNDVMKWLGPILKVIACAVLFLVAGPAGLAVGLFIAAGGDKLLAKGFSMLGTAIQNIPGISPQGAQAFSLIAKVAVYAAMIALCPGAAICEVMGGCQILMNSGIIQDFAADCGASKEWQQYAMMIVMAVVAIAGIAASFASAPEAIEGTVADVAADASEEGAAAANTSETVASNAADDTSTAADDAATAADDSVTVEGENSPYPAFEDEIDASVEVGGETGTDADGVAQGAEEAGSSFGQKVMKKAQENAEWLAQNKDKMETIGDWATKVGGLTSDTMTLWSDVLQAQVLFSKAKVTAAQGDVDALLAMIKQVIKMLEKLISGIMQGIQGLTADVKTLNDFQVSKFQNASQVMTHLMAA